MIKQEQRYYDEIAKKHTGIQAVMHSSKPLAWYRHFLETTVLRRYLEEGPKRICDIGCGNGRFFPLFSEKGYEINGIDFSQELISQIPVSSMSNPSSYCLVADSSDIPFVSETFDYVFLILTLPHDNKEVINKTLDEISRILKPGGKFFLIDEPYTFGSLWTKYSLIYSLPHFKLTEDRFIRSDIASRLLSKNSHKDIKIVNASKESKIQGNIFKDIIKIAIDLWIDIPSILLRKKEAGFERLMILQKNG